MKTINVMKKSKLDKDQMRPVLTGTVLLAVIFLFTLINPSYGTFKNLHSIFMNAMPVGIVAVGISICTMGGFYDMAIGLVACMASMMVGPMMQAGVPVYAVILIALAMGAAAGALTGITVSYLNMDAWISTFALSQIYKTILYVTTDGIPFTLASEEFASFTILARYRIFGVIQLPVVVLIVLYLCCYLFLKYRRLGRRIYLVGNNPGAAYICGINLHKTRMFMFMFSNALGALAGLLFTARAGLAQPFACEAFNFDGIAAAFVGGATGGKGNLFAVFFGVLILFAVRNGLVMAGLPDFWQYMATGLIMIIAVAFQTQHKKS